MCASLPEVTGGPGNLNSKSQNAMSSMSHHLDLVRSGVASIETELQQRASLLAVDNANLRNILENSSSEVAALRAKAKELESTQQKLGLYYISYCSSKLLELLGFNQNYERFQFNLTNFTLHFSQNSATGACFGQGEQTDEANANIFTTGAHKVWKEKYCKVLGYMFLF